MNKIVITLMLYAGVLCAGISFDVNAAVWVHLHENGTSKLMLDKDSILEKDGLKKAWVKVEYRVPQKNNELVEKEFNVSKLLWYFDCENQKAATSQIFQYFNDEIVYSAAIDPKSAQFLEPIPDTDMDISMRHVCGPKKATPPRATDSGVDKAKSDKASLDKNNPNAISEKTNSDKPSTDKPSTDKTSPDKATNPSLKTGDAAKPASTVEKTPTDKTSKATINKSTTAKPESNPTALAKPASGASAKFLAGKTPHWGYDGNEGPESWAKLSPEFAMCEMGRNQSPINIDNTIHAVLKPLKTIQKFAAKEIFNNGHTVQVNFKEGNMMVLDSAAYQLKQVHFHAPSENKIHGESFSLEAHFVHADNKGSLTVIGVMFKEGKENEGLTRLWEQLPTTEGAPTPIKSRVLPSDLIPKNPTYYRFSGSLTTPPCSEGVRWILMKTPMTASKEQIEAFKEAVHHQNNRPVQPLNGRAILE